MLLMGRTRSSGWLRYMSPIFGRPRIGGFVVMPQTGWTVVSARDEGTRLQDLRSQLLRQMLVVAFTALFIGYLAFALARRLSRPLEELAGTMREVRETGLQTHPVPSLTTAAIGSDIREVADLLESYTVLIAALNKRFVEVAAYERLQAFSEEFQAQTEKLQTQNEEITTQNSLIVGHSERLEQQNRELERLSAAASRANEHKGRFLASMSHELRTPLAAIAGAATNLADGVGGELHPSQADLLALVLAGAERLTDMVDDLIQFAELRTRRATLEFSPTPFESLVEEAVVHVSQRAQVDVPDLPCIDARRIFHVLRKLLDNAIKFTPEGGRVTVRARCQGDVVRCEISDTGVGIAPASLPHLFDLFRQLDMSTTREAGGLGLSLALARAYVEGHGGRIGATSEPGSGSVFSFSLPVQNAVGLTLPISTWAPGELAVET